MDPSDRDVVGREEEIAGLRKVGVRSRTELARRLSGEAEAPKL